MKHIIHLLGLWIYILFEMKAFLLVIICLSLASSLDFIKKQLRRDWKMRVISTERTASLVVDKDYDVTVPSTIHLNLEKAKAISDPFKSSNMDSLKWISNCDATFETNITISEQERSFSNVKLIFQGIDTYADIYFNDQHLGSTKNAFLKYEFNVEKYAKVGQNMLRVRINSTKEWDNTHQQKDRMPFEYAQSRKACYQYSWDWAPYMNTLGIWLPVHIHYYNAVKIDYVWIRNKEITQKKAVLDIVLALDKTVDGLLDVELKIRRDHDFQQTIFVKFKYIRTQITINNPVLWWPNNIGLPHVYEFTFQLFKNGSKVDEKKTIYGIRTVQLNDKGANFQIIVNGYPIYCKGANYVPPDMMYPRLINLDFTPKNTFQSLLQDAVQSNFNMLRVWGGGQYEVDLFYELASKKGIMIFQDFMFSDSIYPASPEFLATVKEEVVYQVRRLRNFPCVVLWSGNNEILQGIQSWGWWQSNYVENYEKVFKGLIPSILSAESKDLPYIQSSPSRGVGNAGFSKGGDIHYWGVWAAGSPFDNYETAVGGFNSEFGTQSLPPWKSILEFTFEGERTYDAPGLLFHEKHSSQFRILKNYMMRYSHASLNFELQAYASGLVQAYAIEIAICAQRISKPLSFGTLYWQFNDAWPAISWSSIDYYGRWKPLQYMAKRMYKDIVIFYHPKDKKVYAINDKLFTVETYYLVKALSFQGKILFKEEGKLQLEANEKKILMSIPDSAINGYQRKGVIYTEIIYGPFADNKTVITTFTYDNKNLDIEDSVLDVKFIFQQNKIQFQTSYLIKSLFIDVEGMDLKFSDNYFDVVPGHRVTVEVSGVEYIESIRERFTFKSYRQIFDPSPLRVRLM